MHIEIKKALTTSVENHWLEYKTVLPDFASEIQIIETRRAFYAGMHVFYSFVAAMGGCKAGCKVDEGILMVALKKHRDDLRAFMVGQLNEHETNLKNKVSMNGLH